MNIQIQQFVVIDSSQNLNDIKTSTGGFKWTVNGTKIYPVGSVIPLIRKSKECLGLVKITKVTITETITTVEFEGVVTYGDENLSAFYDLYRTQLTINASESSDVYDEYDQIVPGAFTATKANESKVVSKKSKNKYDSVSSYLEEDEDDVDDLLYSRSDRKRFQNSIYDKLTR